jgi:hypothetical protein
MTLNEKCGDRDCGRRCKMGGLMCDMAGKSHGRCECKTEHIQLNSVGRVFANSVLLIM